MLDGSDRPRTTASASRSRSRPRRRNGRSSASCWQGPTKASTTVDRDLRERLDTSGSTLDSTYWVRWESRSELDRTYRDHYDKRGQSDSRLAHGPTGVLQRGCRSRDNTSRPRSASRGPGARRGFRRPGPRDSDGGGEGAPPNYRRHRRRRARARAPHTPPRGARSPTRRRHITTVTVALSPSSVDVAWLRVRIDRRRRPPSLTAARSRTPTPQSRPGQQGQSTSCV